MGGLKTLFKQTFIYGLATVLPRMLSFLLVPLYTSKAVLPNVSDYGSISLIFSYFIICNILLSYGMETAFFRFFNKEKNTDQVIGTSTISILISSIIFLGFALFFRHNIADITGINDDYITLVIIILVLDALAVIPFAKLRALGKALNYTVIKLLNVSVNLGLNIFFLLYLKKLALKSSFFERLYIADFQISYIFTANVIASCMTLICILPFYFNIRYTFSKKLWKRMITYALPVLIAGIAFSINETSDRILMYKLLPQDVAKADIGIYAACYKLALFMTLFATAYKLGVEPYLFSHLKSDNPQKNYAKILEYFVILGSIILLVVIVFIDVLKVILIQNEAYWEAMSVVPIILLANFFLGIYNNLSVWYKVTDNTKYGAYISISSALLFIVLNIILIPIISYVGCAIATLAAYACMVLASYILGQKYYPIPYKLNHIFLYLFLSISLSAMSFYKFRGQYGIGIGMLGMFLVIIYMLEKKELKTLFNH